MLDNVTYKELDNSDGVMPPHSSIKLVKAPAKWAGYTFSI